MYLYHALLGFQVADNSYTGLLTVWMPCNILEDCEGAKHADIGILCPIGKSLHAGGTRRARGPGARDHLSANFGPVDGLAEALLHQAYDVFVR